SITTSTWRSCLSSRRRHTKWPRDWSSDVCSSDLISLTSLRSAAYSELLRASGGGKRNSEGRVSTQGVIVASCGVAPDALAGGVGRQKPREFGVPAMLCTPKNGGGVGANPSVSLQAQM